MDMLLTQELKSNRDEMKEQILGYFREHGYFTSDNINRDGVADELADMFILSFMAMR